MENARQITALAMRIAGAEKKVLPAEAYLRLEQITNSLGEKYRAAAAMNDSRSYRIWRRGEAASTA